MSAVSTINDQISTWWIWLVIVITIVTSLALLALWGLFIRLGFKILKIKEWKYRHAILATLGGSILRMLYNFIISLLSIYDPTISAIVTVAWLALVLFSKMAIVKYFSKIKWKKSITAVLIWFAFSLIVLFSIAILLQPVLNEFMTQFWQ